MTDMLTPGDRRELRAVVKGRFKLLRAELERRSKELRAEVESQLLERFRAQDAAVHDAQQEVQAVLDDALRQVRDVAARLHDAHPDLAVSAGRDRYTGMPILSADNPTKRDLHAAAVAAIPTKIGEASLTLDRQENGLLEQLSVGALQSEDARRFLAEIPTVGELVPTARLREIEAQLRSVDGDS